jgi:hypothetical protein
MRYPLVRELAAEQIPGAVTCRVLGFCKQAFYKWCARPVSQRDWDDAHPINAAYDIHADDPAFGYRFIADELRPRRREISRTPTFWARHKAISSRSAEDRYRPDTVAGSPGFTPPAWRNHRNATGEDTPPLPRHPRSSPPERSPPRT